MSDQIRVFISHHHSFEEDAFTAQLVGDLERAGFDVWVDEKGVTSGSFVQKISNGLKDRQWLLFIMTPAALASPWVQSEVDAGLQEVHAGRMRAVIPVVAQPCDEAEIPVLWRSLHRYDATEQYAPVRDRLISVLRSGEPSTAYSVTAAQPISKLPLQPTRQRAPSRTLTVALSIGLAIALILGVVAALAYFNPLGRFPKTSHASGETLYQANWTTGLNGWIGSAGWNAVNGQLINDGTDCCNIVAPYRLDSVSDYSVEAQVKILSAQGGVWAILARAQDNNGKLVGYEAGTETLTVNRGGANTGYGFISQIALSDLAKTNLLAPDSNSHLYRLEVSGQLLRWYVDGALLLTAHDSAFTAGGQVGLRCSTGTQITVSSFVVKAL